MMAGYEDWKESLSDDNLLREVVGDDKNDKKRKTNLNEEEETELDVITQCVSPHITGYEYLCVIINIVVMWS